MLLLSEMTAQIHDPVISVIRRAARAARRRSPPEDAEFFTIVMTGGGLGVPLSADWMSRKLTYFTPLHSASDSRTTAPRMKMVLLGADGARVIKNLFAFCCCRPESHILPTIRLSTIPDRHFDEHNICSPITLTNVGILYNIEEVDDTHWYTKLLDHLDLLLANTHATGPGLIVEISQEDYRRYKLHRPCYDCEFEKYEDPSHSLLCTIFRLR